jgi:hypothetical protein
VSADVVDRALASRRDGDEEGFRLVLHPYLHWTTANGAEVRGRRNVLAMLAGREVLGPPSSVELRDGQIYRWAE